MRYTTSVKVVEEGSNRPVPGLQVALFDRDAFSPDDALGTGTSDEQGEVRFDYNSEQFVDLDDRLGGVFPELYVVVSDAGGTQIVTTKADAISNTPRKQIPVPVPAGRAS